MMISTFSDSGKESSKLEVESYKHLISPKGVRSGESSYHTSGFQIRATSEDMLESMRLEAKDIWGFQQPLRSSLSILISIG